ncbi:hypothetical protein [Anaeropeptidivorans aminofermentans]|jgi:hypothetical protein|uniref:hypothetical protein n=1 Tax=Anaeropeptidivorans aminofermentans TaxID=2934315 RepID=UPI002024B854|nr:hypothetical protein [Anaeropeptidivorans aminofermentans]MBE6011928.1 hypothetical protein [Lachnospiraceae bacterium]
MDIGKKFPIIVSTLTGIITIIYSFAAEFHAFKTIRSLLIVMVISFVLSTILKVYLDKKVFYEGKSDTAGNELDDETLEGTDPLYDMNMTDFTANADNLEDDSLIEEEEPLESLSYDGDK